MKKHTLPLCGLAISLGLMSSAMAAPTSGTQTINGTLSAPTCTISMPTEYKVPGLTVNEIVSRKSGDYLKVSLGVINIKNCSNVSASAINSAGQNADALGNGRFLYASNVNGIYFSKEPLAYQLERVPNSQISDGRIGNLFKMNGSNEVSIKDGDTLTFHLTKGQATDVSKEYIGGYSTDLTFTFNYS
ncbi:type 1 fimbrial protein [Salmonella enterica]|nr:type 1 fimbrial protein [Salmonella enterica]